MAYIRDNDDWYHANGDYRSREQRVADLEKQKNDKHIPDSIREEIEREINLNKIKKPHF